MRHSVPYSRFDHIKSRTSGKATAATVCALVGLLCWAFTALPAVILGLLALRDMRRESAFPPKGKGLAWFGVIFGGLMLLASPMMLLFTFAFFEAKAEFTADRYQGSLFDLRETAIGLEEYRAQHGVYPSALSELVDEPYYPYYILPQDPYSPEGARKTFGYASNGRMFVLRSLGPDSDADANLTHVAQGLALGDVTMGMTMKYDPTNGTGSSGDLILWGP